MLKSIMHFVFTAYVETDINHSNQAKIVYSKHVASYVTFVQLL